MASDEAEHMTALSANIHAAAPFLQLRNSLRHQILKVQNQSSSGLLSINVMEGSAGSSSGSMLNNNLVAAVRALGSQESSLEENAQLRQSTIEYIQRVLNHPAKTQQQQQQGNQQPQHPLSSIESRNFASNRLSRDAMVWCTRSVDSHLKLKRTKAKRRAPLAQRSTSPPQSKDTLVPASPPTPMDNVLAMIAAGQREWRALVNVRIESLKILASIPGSRSSTQSSQNRDNNGGEDGASSPTKSSTQSNASPAITTDDLYGVVVERVNGSAQMTAKKKQAQGPSVSTGPYLDLVGLFSSFTSAVHQLVDDAGLVPSISQLREAFADLDPAVGTSRVEHTHLSQTSTAASEQQFLLLLDSGDRPEKLCSLAMRGIAPSMRRLFYAKALNFQLSIPASSLLHGSVTCDTKRVKFATANASKALADSVLQGRNPSGGDSTQQSRLLLRQMTMTDVQSRVGDSDKYFVFVDESTAVAAAMLEDRNIADYHLKKVVEQRGDDFNTYTVSMANLSGPRIPLCGLMPIASSTAVIGPLNYVTGDICELYELAAAMQGQVWGPMQSCTSDILMMMILFERLVAHFAPAATFHCFSKLSTPPLMVVMKWMLNGFVELFEPTETLQLWDVLLAVHCRSHFGLSKARPSWLIAAQAAAVFVFRGALIQQCMNGQQVVKMFEDGVKLKPIPMLQQLLFLM